MSYKIEEFVSDIFVVFFLSLIGCFLEMWVCHGECVLVPQIEVVVYPPIDVAYLPRGVEQALQEILKNDGRSEAAPQRVDGFVDGLDQMRRCFEDVWPHKVEKVEQGVLDRADVVEVLDESEREMLDRGAGRLSMDEVSDNHRRFGK